MNTKRFGFAGVFAAFALAVSTLVAPSASAATEIVVWADESRGPNLTKVIAAKGDWVSGYTVKVVTFSSFDALRMLLIRQLMHQDLTLLLVEMTGSQPVQRAESWHH
ncbi:MAG: hypothetical protein RL690_608 [Actinomycetota bacterium]